MADVDMRNPALPSDRIIPKPLSKGLHSIPFTYKTSPPSDVPVT